MQIAFLLPLILPQYVHSSCHICWGRTGSGFALCPVSLHRTPRTEALGLWPLSCLRKPQSTHTTDGSMQIFRAFVLLPFLPSISLVGNKGYYCNKEGALTFNMYITFDLGAKNSSYPLGRAGDTGQDELLRCFLHLGGWETAAVLSHEGRNDRNPTKFCKRIIHLLLALILWQKRLKRFRPQRFQVLGVTLTRGGVTWHLLISVN